MGIHAVNSGRVHAGDSVAIMGCGPVGILTAMAARRRRHLYCHDRSTPGAARHAARLGADLVLDPSAGEVVRDITRAAGPVDIAFEAAGTQGAIDDATLVVRPAGTAVIIGIPAEDRIALWAHHLRRKELNIIMSRRSSFELEPAIRMMAAGLLRPEQVITHTFPLAQLADGMQFVHEYRDGVLKAMIVME